MSFMEKKMRTMCLAAIVAGVASATASAASNLSMTATDSTPAIGNQLVVTVGVNGDAVDGVGAQFVIKYDASKLSLPAVSGNRYALVSGSPLDYELYESHSISGNVGTFIVALGTTEGNSDVEIDGGLITLSFNCDATICNDAGGKVYFSADNGFESMISDAQGLQVSMDAATDLAAITYHHSVPAFAGVPAGVSYWADATGLSRAVVTLTPPTASDACSTSLTVSDDRPAGNAYGAGATTTVTWSATDVCGNTATATTSVDVSADSLAVVRAAQSGAVVANSFTRGLRLEISKAGATSETEVMTANMVKAGSGGDSRAESSLSGNTVQLAGSVNWASSACARVSDPLHTLRRVVAVSTSSDTGSHSSRSYNSRYIVNGVDSSSDWLLVGNANGDTKIDILDFGVFASQRNASVALNTTSSTSGPHCDFNASSDDTAGTADVTNADLTYLSITFFSTDESCGSYTGDAPLSRISVKELRRSGQGHLAAGDVNGDGWVDTTDLALMLQGQTGQPVRTGSSGSGNVAW
ncbi:MAG: HYR domain-containing protein [Planctomycetota bacterium]